MNKAKDMQDRQDASISCSHCGRIVVTPERAKIFSEAQKVQAFHHHKCTKAQESKRDFEQEVM